MVILANYSFASVFDASNDLPANSFIIDCVQRAFVKMTCGRKYYGRLGNGCEAKFIVAHRFSYWRTSIREAVPFLSFRG